MSRLITVSIPDALDRFVLEEQRRTGRSAQEIIRLSLVQREVSVRRYLAQETTLFED
ncbi:hypothetical protein [Mesorhizobium sp. B1-1-5]|uniref:hypothetical protein n=1 Tax=Mesorhizobium sp. B1-1-5 TaxID=2589979 RepID=UPI0015E36AD4|nr:hypothetical protein [Mesorhizobium sp. B1-1-5]